MLTYMQDDLLSLSVEAIVNPVNCVGIMGAGLAKAIKDKYPENYRLYAEACQRGEVKTGRIFVYDIQLLWKPRYVLNFPTKRHWKQPSELSFIEEGLVDLVRVVRELQLNSIAIPALGCGLGGLGWEQVRPKIEAAFQMLPKVDVRVIPPKERAQ